MSKHFPTRSNGRKRRQAPIPAANSADTGGHPQPDDNEWYCEHREVGGEPDPVAEHILAEIAALEATGIAVLQQGLGVAKLERLTSTASRFSQETWQLGSLTHGESANA
jgi:hypothetical protein